MTSRASTTSDNYSLVQVAAQSLENALGSDLIAVILFGSRARNDAQENSDWDLLVIAENLPTETLARHLLLKRSLPIELRGVVSILALTPKEFLSSLSSLYLDIALDGKIFYDSHNFASNHLAYVRQQIEDSGLLREHTPAGDIWTWQGPQPTTWHLEWGN